jgi:hypothetical protein
MPIKELEAYTREQVLGLGFALGFIVMLAITFYLLNVIATWKLLEKAGEKGWKSLIPIYNSYLLYKIVGAKNWFWILLGTTFVGSIICTANGFDPNQMTTSQIEAYDYGAHPIVVIALLVMAAVTIATLIIYSMRTAKAFKKGVGYTIGLIFFPNLFLLILGLGNAKYNKKLLKEEEK